MSAHRQFALQAATAFLLLSVAWPYYYLRDVPWNWGLLSLLIGISAFLAAYFSRQPWWWRLIHGGFAPLLWLGQQLTISPLWHLAAFLTLLLIFRGAAFGQIPLYLSGKSTANQLSVHLPSKVTLIDLGAGIGSLLLPLARLRPDLHLTGIDNAPLPWAIGKIRTLSAPNIHWHWNNLWQHDLSPYNAVFCFLSPVPMEAIWEKATSEMTPGTLLISKAFPIPGVTPEFTDTPTDEPVDTLFFYRIPGRN